MCCYNDEEVQLRLQIQLLTALALAKVLSTHCSPSSYSPQALCDDLFIQAWRFRGFNSAHIEFSPGLYNTDRVLFVNR